MSIPTRTATTVLGRTFTEVYVLDFINVVSSITTLNLQQQDSSQLYSKFTIFQSAHNKWKSNTVCLSFNPNCDWGGDILVMNHSSADSDMFVSVVDEMEAVELCQVLAHTSQPCL